MPETFTKAILHIDADAFFASVEVAKNPKLKGKPIVTGYERGIASSMSYEAKALGITRAMPVFQIKKYFPQVKIIHSDYEAYTLYSDRLFAIIRRYADTIEEYSIDECFADLTGYCQAFGYTYEEALRSIQRVIDVELNIPVSLGLSSTKVLAKVASKWNKPHGVTVIRESEKEHMLTEIPVGKLWGIGRATTELLWRKGIRTAADLMNAPQEFLDRFAHKPLLDIWNELNGRSVFKIHDGDEEPPLSISKTKTFSPSTRDHQYIFAELSRNLENACIKARRHGLSPTRVDWYIKTTDLKHQSFSFKLPEPTNAPSHILDLLEREFAKVSTDRHLYRATGITFSELRDTDRLQTDLFGKRKGIEKLESIFSFIDRLSFKYGRHAVTVASGMAAHTREAGQYEPTHSQTAFLRRFHRQGKELGIPYLGEAV